MPLALTSTPAFPRHLLLLKPPSTLLPLGLCTCGFLFLSALSSQVSGEGFLTAFSPLRAGCSLTAPYFLWVSCHTLRWDRSSWTSHSLQIWHDSKKDTTGFLFSLIKWHLHMVAARILTSVQSEPILMMCIGAQLRF